MRISRNFGLAAPIIALALSACGTPTVEYQVKRCQTALDNLDVLATKQPQLRQDIDRKKLELVAEFDKVKGLQGEEGSKTIGDVCYRIEKYHTQLAPAAPTAPTTPGGKLGATPGQPAQPGQTPPSGGKLGATPGQPAQPGAPTPAPAGDSGFGGAAPAPGAPAPAGDSGFGGAAPGGTAPAPTPAPAPAPGGGFGGQ